MTTSITLKKFILQSDEPSTDRNFVLTGMRQLQEEQLEWVRHNFPHADSETAMLKLVEETGELADAMYNMKTGTRETHAKARSKAADALGDIFISLIGVASALSIDFESTLKTEWDKVMFRDWQRCPTDGVTPREKPGKPEKDEASRRGFYLPHK